MCLFFQILSGRIVILVSWKGAFRQTTWISTLNVVNAPTACIPGYSQDLQLIKIKEAIVLHVESSFQTR